MFQLSVKMQFSAAHYLEGYQGKCQRLHGHNWEVAALVSGPYLDDLGMVIDFGDLKRLLGEVLDGLDHRHLNEIDAFASDNPTAENIARHIYRHLKEKLAAFRPEVRLESIQVWETPGCSILYEEAER